MVTMKVNSHDARTTALTVEQNNERLRRDNENQATLGFFAGLVAANAFTPTFN